jgi:hypothetical protein
MTAEVTSGCKFTQAMPNHVFGDVNGHMTSAIMYGDGMTNHLREDGASPAPGSEHFLFSGGIHRFDSFQKLRGYKRPFFKRS